MPPQWYQLWGYIHVNGIAPVWIGEFGGYNTDNSSLEGVWQNLLVQYIYNTTMHWSYWDLNPNSGDTGGIFENDWVTLVSGKVTMLNPILHE
jgi:endoglucanase